MNLNVLKALSVPGLVSDSAIMDLLHYNPQAARIVSDLCIGSGGIAAPELRLGGVDVIGTESHKGAVVLATPDGFPVCEVKATSVTSYYTHLLSRGGERETIESSRPSYIVNRVREKIGRMRSAAGEKQRSMYVSSVGQIADYFRSRGNQSQTMSVTAQTIYDLTNSILNGLPVDTGAMQTLHVQAQSLISSKSEMLRGLQEELLDRKWWFVANHGDYGFAVYKPTFPSTLTAKVLVDSMGRGELQQSQMNPIGWFKSLAHMQQVCPDEYNNFYVQLVMTKQVIGSMGRDVYKWSAPIKRESMFGRLDVSADYDLRPFCPSGDFFIPEAALSSWSYSETNAKTGTYFMMECVE